MNDSASTSAILVLSWHSQTHDALVRSVLQLCEQRSWEVTKRLHARQPPLPEAIQVAMRFLAGCGVTSATMYTVLRSLECYNCSETGTEAGAGIRSAAVDSVIFHHDNSIISWLSFHGFGGGGTMELSAALFPAEVHGQLVATWERVRCDGPALSFLDFLRDVEAMSRCAADHCGMAIHAQYLKTEDAHTYPRLRQPFSMWQVHTPSGIWVGGGRPVDSFRPARRSRERAQEACVQNAQSCSQGASSWG